MHETIVLFIFPLPINTMMPFFLLIMVFCSSILSAQNHVYTTLLVAQAPELEADAGNDIISSGAQITIGGSPTAIGGTAPYTYSWSPQEYLSNPTLSNPSLTPGQEIDYTVTITDSKGCTASDEISIKITSTRLIQNQDIVFYPNPASESIVIQSNAHHTLIDRLQIFDSSGRIIKEQVNVKITSGYIVDVSQFSAGKYLVCVEFSGKKNYAPLIIER